jgi:hypothetical protein
MLFYSELFWQKCLRFPIPPKYGTPHLVLQWTNALFEVSWQQESQIGYDKYCNNICKILVGKPGGKRSLRHPCVRYINAKMNIKAAGFGEVN